MEQGQQPPTPVLTEEAREKAEKRLSQKMVLYSHIAAYIIVSAFLVLIWALTRADSNSDCFWPVWVMIGWGIGLCFHIFAYLIGRRGETMRERMLRKELDKAQKERGRPPRTRRKRGKEPAGE